MLISELQANESLCLKIRWRVMEENTCHQPIASIQTHTLMDTHSPTKTLLSVSLKYRYAIEPIRCHMTCGGAYCPQIADIAEKIGTPRTQQPVRATYQSQASLLSTCKHAPKDTLKVHSFHCHISIFTHTHPFTTITNTTGKKKTECFLYTSNA